MDINLGNTEQLLSSIHDGLYITDKNRQIIYWNRAAEHITGFAAEEVIGKSCYDQILTHVDANGLLLCTHACPLAATIEDSIPREADVFLHHKSGHRVPVNVRVSAIHNEQGEVTHAIELFTDISNREITELRIKELEQAANLDHLTNLANRKFLETDLKKRFMDLNDYNIPFGLLFIDIDNFKKVNDTYGHDIGDEVLKMAANTYMSASRPFDLFGRWGGEEFIGIIPNIDAEQLVNYGNQVKILIENSYVNTDQGQLSVTISLGATLAKQSDDIESLVKRADEFMYQSKMSGKNRLTFG